MASTIVSVSGRGSSTSGEIVNVKAPEFALARRSATAVRRPPAALRTPRAAPRQRRAALRAQRSARAAKVRTPPQSVKPRLAPRRRRARHRLERVDQAGERLGARRRSAERRRSLKRPARGNACISCPSRRGKARCGRPGPSVAGFFGSRSATARRRRPRRGSPAEDRLVDRSRTANSFSPVAGSRCWNCIGGGGGSGCLEAHLDAQHLRDDRLVPLRDQLLEQLEGFRLVFVERVALRHAAPADHLTQMVERDQMLAPQMIERLQDDLLLDDSASPRASCARRARA